MVKVTVGKAEDPWCEIELTEEDVEATAGGCWSIGLGGFMGYGLVGWESMDL